MTAGGGVALITLPSGEEGEVRTPAGAVCSSTRAELVAMRSALEELRNLGAALERTSVVRCTVSQAALATLATGAGLGSADGAGCRYLTPAARHLSLT